MTWTIRSLRHSRSGLLGILVSLAAAHSLILGALLLAAPHWLFGVWGWQTVCEGFFLQQVGIFHVLLGIFYFWEWRTRRGVFMLVTAKTSAFVFLVLQTILREPQLSVMLAGLLDGAIAAVVWWLRRTEVPRVVPKSVVSR